MRNTRNALLYVGLVALLLIVLDGQLAFGQDDTVERITGGHGPADDEMVPGWIFHWVLGAAVVIVVGMCGALGLLWTKLNAVLASSQAAENGLSSDQANHLRELWDGHIGPNAKDADGIFKWYVPRPWGDKLEGSVRALAKIERQLAEAGGLQGRLDTEQTERRKEVERLLAERLAIFRDVLETTKSIEGLGLAVNQGTDAAHKLGEKIHHLVGVVEELRDQVKALMAARGTRP